jgi:hypothetical protein
MAAQCPSVRSISTSRMGSWPPQERAKNRFSQISQWSQSLVEAVLLALEIRPFHSEARLSLIAVAIYDIAVYTREYGPINLSLKTTIRARWKQADLEGAALKNVHKRSKVYLINNSPMETRVRRDSLPNCISIDEFIVCSGSAFGSFIEDLRSGGLSPPPTPR